MRYAVVVALFCALAVRLSGQAPAPRSADEVRFEAASIRPLGRSECQPSPCQGFSTRLPGRFSGTRMSVLGLVGIAYSTPMSRIIGPDWAKWEQFDIEATHGLPVSDLAGLRTMLQHLLQERFSLQVHREERRMAVYVLSTARSDGRLGPQLVNITGCSDRPGFLPSYYKGCGGLDERRAATRAGMGTWADLALYRQLQESLDRIVVDETGLEGWFAALLEWSDDGLSASPQATTTAPNRPDLLTALREQLGLKLERAERPLEVIVIDSVRPPTPN